MLDFFKILGGHKGMPHSAILMQTDIFYGIDRDDINPIARICKERTYRKGETIFEENSSGDELYVIAEGEVEILVDPAMVSAQMGTPIEDKVIARLHRGQSFGEIALVDQGIRSATARSASKNTRLLIIPRNEILSLCEENPKIGYRLMRNLAVDLSTKLRGTDFQIRDQLLRQEFKDE
jgi:CRP/FNR family cyclic AMP-dependent transcriptional regulator